MANDKLKIALFMMGKKKGMMDKNGMPMAKDMEGKNDTSDTKEEETDTPAEKKQDSSEGKNEPDDLATQFKKKSKFGKKPVNNQQVAEKKKPTGNKALPWSLQH